MPGRRIVGIDLGTTHTVVAWADPSRDMAPQVFPISQLVSTGEVTADSLLPSFLYAPIAGENIADPYGDAPWALGAFARKRGGEVPGRLVASSKSWLAHAAVDRMAPILPWGAPEDAEDLPRISPVDAAMRILLHIRTTWNEAFPEYPLEVQEVVLTVPASFDEDARELTVEAAKRANLEIRLLEEPQAAFYDTMARSGPDELDALCRRAGGEALVLVCDVGGGTTDLSLIRVKQAENAKTTGEVDVERVAVGRHLLLGGDNMDLALAYACEKRLIEPPDHLSPSRFGQLVLACRLAKEKLLSENPPDEVNVTLLGSGSRLLGSSLTTKLTREETERLVLDGFLPPAKRDDRPRRGGGALVAFGLPYERDVAITRHVAHFFARHAPNAAAPTALLLNGGVFRAPRIVARLADSIAAWSGQHPEILPHPDPDLAVARGAVVYGLSLLGRGVRIGGGAARGYYVGISGGIGQTRQAVCVVPRGAREGILYDVPDRTFSLTLGRAVRFPLFASDEALDLPGTVVTIDSERFQALPPVSSAFEPGAKAEIPVSLSGQLSAIGTLELSCLELTEGNTSRRFRLTWDLREASPTADEMADAAQVRDARTNPQIVLRGKRWEDAQEAILRVYGKGRVDVTPREVKDLFRELEKLAGDRAHWTLETNRLLFDVLWQGQKGRKRSADHERVFWQLAGYCLRPGFGHPLDAERASNLFSLFPERLAFSQEARTWQQFWIAWRRIAGGLDEQAQLILRDLLDPFLAPAEKRLKKPKGFRAEPDADIVDLAAALERISSNRRSELGGFLLERTWTNRDPRVWAAIGRIGARIPAYASLHHVIAPGTAERWIDHLLRDKWHDLPTAPRAAMELSRMTGDRARDVSERVRRDVIKRLENVGAKEEWIRAIREVVVLEEADRVAFYGEGLPVGLALVV